MPSHRSRTESKSAPGGRAGRTTAAFLALVSLSVCVAAPPASPLGDTYAGVSAMFDRPTVAVFEVVVSLPTRVEAGTMYYWPDEPVIVGREVLLWQDGNVGDKRTTYTEWRGRNDAHTHVDLGPAQVHQDDAPPTAPSGWPQWAGSWTWYDLMPGTYKVAQWAAWTHADVIDTGYFFVRGDHIEARVLDFEPGAASLIDDRDFEAPVYVSQTDGDLDLLVMVDGRKTFTFENAASLTYLNAWSWNTHTSVASLRGPRTCPLLAYQAAEGRSGGSVLRLAPPGTYELGIHADAYAWAPALGDNFYSHPVVIAADVPLPVHPVSPPQEVSAHIPWELACADVAVP